MKKILVTAAISAALGLASIGYSQSFVGNPTPAANDTGVFAYWNFNNLSIATASAPGSGGVPTAISSTFGTASLSLSAWTGLVDDFGGSLLNAEESSVAGASLSLVSNVGNGSYIQFSFSMTNLADLVIDFDTRGTSTGFNSGLWSYSTNGTTFTDFGISTATTSGTFATVSPGIAISALDGATTAYLRYTLNGATTASGNNRIDNLSLAATYSPIPEPSTYAAIFGGVALAGVTLTRRRRASHHVT